MKRLLTIAGVALALMAQAAPQKPGVQGRQQPFPQLRPAASFQISHNADWVLILPHEVWVGGAGPHVVHAIDRATNRDRATISLPGEPCAGLAAGFGSLWVPMCGSTPSIARIDLRTHRIVATIPMGPAEEGGIAVSGNGVWFTSDDAGTLVRLDPRTNTVAKTIRIAAGSHNPIVDGDLLWITSVDHDLVTAVDTRTGTVLATVPTGPQPRFLTAGAGAVWTLNQGDGSVTRIDARTRRAVATVALGIPGHGGDIAYANGIIWATTVGLPLTAIDARTNQVRVQWVGPGGDSLKADNRSIWLTDYRAGTLARIHVADALPRPNRK